MHRFVQCFYENDLFSAVKGTVASREDLEGFVSFLVVLKNHYRDNLEIPRTVIQLLHIYQPEQGLDEYLRVCK